MMYNLRIVHRDFLFYFPDFEKIFAWTKIFKLKLKKIKKILRKSLKK